MAGVKFTASLAKGMKILEAFTPALPRMKLLEIAERTQLPKVTVFRLVRTLMTLGYIFYDSASRTYSLTPRVLSLGFAALSSVELRDVALPHMQELSRVTDQNVNLGILDKTEVVYVETIKKKQPLRLSLELHVGSTVNVYQTSIGRVFLAFMDPDRLASTVSELLKDPKVLYYIGEKGERLAPILEEIRRRGYALTDGDFVPGVRTIAAPVFDKRGDVEGAINMPVFAYVVSLERLTGEFAALLLKTAERISTARGFSGAAKDAGPRSGLPMKA
ncbi:MAG: IclR family transcriptional regulator [Thermodesulfobacteriota bacterium]